MIIATILVSVGVNVGLRSETIEAEVCSQCPLLCQHIVSYFCKSVQSIEVYYAVNALYRDNILFHTFAKIDSACITVCTLCALLVRNINGLETAIDYTNMI